jgi:large subunit ribosomal protein L30
MATTSGTDLVEITQIRSTIGAKEVQRRTLRALGLRRIRQTVTQPDRPEIHGMLASVAHLIEVRRPGDDAPLGLEPGQEPTTQDEEDSDLK